MSTASKWFPSLSEENGQIVGLGTSTPELPEETNSPYTLPKLPEGPWRLHYPFRSNYLPLKKGALLHYLDEGKGEPLVMVHGNPTWSFMYRKLVSSFSDGFRAVALDHLGMGLSSRAKTKSVLADHVAHLEALLKHLGIDKDVNLVAHDWGGPIALGWAVENPEKVKTLTLMNTGVRLPEGVKIPLRLKLFQANRQLCSFLAGTLGLFTKGLLKRATVRPIPRDIRAGYQAPYRLECHRKAIVDFIGDIPLKRSHPSRALLEKIQLGMAALKHKPFLLVWGLQDFVFTPDYLYDLKNSFPLSRTLALPRSGHWPLEDEPRKVMDALWSFLSGKR
jgi:haloalkane dehalogenase